MTCGCRCCRLQSRRARHPDFPADLIALQRQRLAAQAAVEAYADQVDARLHADPDPEQPITGLRWTAEDRAELARLRAARDELVFAVRAHPILVSAVADRRWAEVWDALQAACRQDAEQPQA